jgi:hypothetical protein
MAKPSLQLIDALRKSARLISDNKDSYNWKAIGACNCGNLVQVVTKYNAKEISTFGIKKHGDWQSISLLYDKDSGYEIDKIISVLLDMGMELEDFAYLENLNSEEVLGYLGKDVFLTRDNPDDAILYLNSWAELLEEKMLDDISIELIKQEAFV